MKKKININQICNIILIVLVILLFISTIKYKLLSNKLAEEARYYKTYNEILIKEGGK